MGSNLEIMRNHPVQTHIFAIGGKDQDLCVYNIEELLKDKELEVTDAAGPQKNTSTHKKKSTKNMGLIFQAKNVRLPALS